MTSQTTEKLEQKTESIESFNFQQHMLSAIEFNRILKSNNLTTTKSDSHYFTSSTDIRKEPGQRHVEKYYYRNEKRDLMRGKILLLQFKYSREEEWQYDGQDSIQVDSGSLSLYQEDILARTIFEQAKQVRETK